MVDSKASKPPARRIRRGEPSGLEPVIVPDVHPATAEVIAELDENIATMFDSSRRVDISHLDNNQKKAILQSLLEHARMTSVDSSTETSHIKPNESLKYDGFDRNYVMNRAAQILDYNLDHFSAVLDVATAAACMARGPGFVRLVAEHLPSFAADSREGIMRTIVDQYQQPDYLQLIDNENPIVKLDHDLALYLIRAGGGKTVMAELLPRLPEVDYEEIAYELLQADDAQHQPAWDANTLLMFIRQGVNLKNLSHLAERGPLSQHAIRKLLHFNFLGANMLRYTESQKQQSDVVRSGTLSSRDLGDYIFDHPTEFAPLNKACVLEMAKSYISLHDILNHSAQLEPFTFSKAEVIALIDDGKVSVIPCLLDYPQYFNDLDKEVSLKLVTAEHCRLSDILRHGAMFGSFTMNKADVWSLIASPECIRPDVLKDMQSDVQYFDGVQFDKNETITLLKKYTGDAAELILDCPKYFSDSALDSAVAGQIFSLIGDSGLEITKIFPVDIDFVRDLITAGHGKRVSGESDLLAIVYAGYEPKYHSFIRQLVRADCAPYFQAEDLTFLFELIDVDVPVVFTAAAKERKLHYLSLFDLNTLAKNRAVQTSTLASSPEAEKIFTQLSSEQLPQGQAEQWQDQALNAQFVRAADIFGYQAMFEFARPTHRHDALYAMGRIILLYERSNLAPAQFFNNILRQVANDGGGHTNGSNAYQRLNAITENFDFGVTAIREQAQAFAGVFSDIDELVRTWENVSSVCSNWKMLMKYADIVLLLKKKELQVVVTQAKTPALRNYAGRLLTHPTITNPGAVQLFVTDPDKFFGLPSSYTTTAEHDAKKPTNYYNIPHLDLTAEQLRDSLVEGALDRVQVWEPLEITYTVPADYIAYQQFQKIRLGMHQLSLPELLLATLGSRQQQQAGILPEVVVKKCLGDLQHAIPASTSTTRIFVKDIIQQRVVVPADVENNLRSIVAQAVDQEYIERLKQWKQNSMVFHMKVNLKSDPDAVVAGNDTQSCMPFGDGKNTLYTFNPITALATMQRQIDVQTWRTIAQSVLTKDKDVHVNIAGMKKQLLSNNPAQLHTVLPQDVLMQAKSFLAADSVEVAENYKKPLYDALIQDLYADFFAEYMQQFGQAQRLNTNKMIVGSCTYTLPDLATESNTYLPAAPIAYSDKYKETVQVMNLAGRRSQFLERQVVSKPRPQLESQQLSNPLIHYLTFEDTLETGYIEGKVYAKTSLKEGFAQMENMLIAKDINNAAKQRPNLSLKYVNAAGMMQAYLVAYEGRLKEKTTDQTEPIIYMADLARLPDSSKGVGLELVNQFIQLYFEQYINQGKMIPIYARARETTSYKLIKRNLEIFGEALGITFNLEDERVMEDGEAIHLVTIRPQKKV